MSIAIIKYNAGNVFSVECAMRRIGAEAVVTADPEVISRADRVIFPGVGEAAAAMAHLRATGLDGLIRSLRQPVLGICIGQQLMCASSQEGGGVDCLGIFDVPVVRFDPADTSVKVPHTGWDTLSLTSPGDGPLPEDADGQWVYYVHSYYVPRCPYTTAVTVYGGTEFSAAMHRDNFHATQFHPEKSGAAGEAILRNFLTL